jgi:hypothetical protein
MITPAEVVVGDGVSSFRGVVMPIARRHQSIPGSAARIHPHAAAVALIDEDQVEVVTGYCGTGPRHRRGRQEPDGPKEDVTRCLRPRRRARASPNGPKSFSIAY